LQKFWILLIILKRGRAQTLWNNNNKSKLRENLVPRMLETIQLSDDFVLFQIPKQKTK